MPKPAAGCRRDYGYWRIHRPAPAVYNAPVPSHTETAPANTPLRRPQETTLTQQQTIAAAEAAYRRLGVDPIINATGSVTRLGGTRTRPEVLAQMAGAARVMVNIDQLNEKAGVEIARLTGAEAGLVTSGAAGGLLLQAAACIAGGDPARMQRLPDDTGGMPNEIIIHTMHRFPYDQAYRAAGARLVEIGNYLFTHPLGTGSRHQRAHRRRGLPLRPLYQPPRAAPGPGLRHRPSP